MDPMGAFGTQAFKWVCVLGRQNKQKKCLVENYFRRSKHY